MTAGSERGAGRILVVTGTGTGVGKTVVTAALAAITLAGGARVAVLKPAQTGVVAGEPGDLDEVRRLVGPNPSLTTRELARYPDPLAPATAAARAGRAPVTPAATVAAATALAAAHDLVLVEGAGGLLVRFVAPPTAADPTGPGGEPAGPGGGSGGGTVAEVAALLAAPVLVVTAPGLGTLNHTALTTEALAVRGLPCAGLVIGSWPADPDLAATTNLTDLPAVTGVPLRGRLPAGAGGLRPSEFLATARAGLAPVQDLLR